MRTSGVVFDFDGTIVDTETPVYESWAETFRRAGAEPIPLMTWLRDIGKSDGSGLDVRALLCAQLGVEALSGDLERRRNALRDEMVAAQPIRNGVCEWIDAVETAGVPLAVASSSPSRWVRPHLERLGLDGRFGAVSCADPGIAGKPDPTVYLTACRELDVDPSSAVAIEDSTHGVSAAIAAGMRCLAVPGPITRTMDFDHATQRVDSLADANPADWL